jgi:UDP-N-acetylmuramoyl-L-alanyl-D-glutamate--2,6-diaminopimelate ligase
MNKAESNLLDRIKQLKELEWKIQDSNLDSALFYYFPEDTRERRDNFHKALENAHFGLCITNVKNIELEKVICLESNDWDKLLEESCDYFYPLKKSLKIGVTGTNGKTTTTDILRQLLKMKNKSVLTIGTLGVWLNNQKKNDFGLTTPNYIDLRKELCLHEYEYLILEASSHALEQNRFKNLEFDYGLWTSFSQDHLDYHKTMDEYFKAKMKIFNKTKKKVFLFEDFKYLTKIKSEKLIVVKDKKKNLNEYFSISYNKKNLLLALAVLEKESISIDNDDLEGLVATPGRFNIYSNKDKIAIVDFAHTPDALLNIGFELKKIFSKKKILTVMGCGGDRDHTKRPLMGEACTKFSDYIYVTSDNPRTESPLNIMKDIEIGIKNTPYSLIVDRTEAIREAMKVKDSVVLIAGKGHENYIDQNGIKTYYSDEEEVKKVLDALC